MNLLIPSLRIFVTGGYLAYVANFRWFRIEPYICAKVLGPLGQLFFFTLLGNYASGRDNSEFYVVGNAMLGAALSGVWGVGMTLGQERSHGMLPYLFGTPANRLAMLAGRSFVNVVDGVLGVVLGFLFGFVFLGVDLERADSMGLLLVILITTLSTCALGLVLGCLVLISVNGSFVFNTAYFALLVLSGSNVPMAEMPPAIQLLGQFVPLTRGLEAARELVAGAPLGQVAPLLVGEAAIGAVYFLAGYIFFSATELIARRRGTLEQL